MKVHLEVYWNNYGSEGTQLEMFDAISVPPGVCRDFTNISDTEGILQVIISGSVHNLNDIDLAVKTGEKIEPIKPGLLKTF